MSTKDHFHINGYALSLSFKQKFWATRKWPTVYSNTNELVDCKQSLLWSEGNRAGNEGGSLSFSRFQSRAWSFSCLLRFPRRTKKKTETALSLTSQPLFELSSSKWERETKEADDFLFLDFDERFQIFCVLNDVHVPVAKRLIV